MTRMSLLLVAAMACLTIGCERHAASELGNEGGEGAQPRSEANSARTPEATAPAPDAIPANPAGSAPVDLKSKKGPEYFPAGK